jgi:hypothetical protein
MGSEAVKEAVEDADQVMDFVTMGMFIVGMLNTILLPSALVFESFSAWHYVYFPLRGKAVAVSRLQCQRHCAFTATSPTQLKLL